eukprot:974224-Rhodomonas_salina.1
MHTLYPGTRVPGYPVPGAVPRVPGVPRNSYPGTPGTPGYPGYPAYLQPHHLVERSGWTPENSNSHLLDRHAQPCAVSAKVQEGKGREQC